MRHYRTAMIALILLLTGGCFSTDHPPTPTTASFDLKPVPKRVEKNGVLQTVFVDFPVSVFQKMKGENAVYWVKKMEDPASPDHRRQGIYHLDSYSYGQNEPYTERYRQIAQSDADFTVRAAAIRALNRSRDTKAVPIFIISLNDQNMMVRLEAAKALSNIPSASAADSLAIVVANQAENKDVRIAAAEALRHYRNVGTARVLAGTLDNKTFGIAWQARWSLKIMTGTDLGYDESAWLAYLTGPKDPFAVNHGGTAS